MSDPTLFISRSMLDASALHEGAQETEYLRKTNNILDTKFASGPRRFEFSTFFLGSISVIELVASPRSSERKRGQIDLDGHDSIFAQLVVEGSARGSSRRLRWDSTPGTVMILDVTQPFTVVDHDTRHVINVAFPRHMFASRIQDVAKLHGEIVPADRADLFSVYLIDLARRIDRIPAAAGPAFGTILFELLLVALNLVDTTQQGTRLQRLRAKASAMIDARLSSRTLAPATLAASLGVSRSELYRCFEGEGGVERAIWNHRLEAAKRVLDDPNAIDRIAVIASNHGFSGPSHFSRAFKAKFGITPAGLRKAMLGPHAYSSQKR